MRTICTVIGILFYLLSGTAGATHHADSLQALLGTAIHDTLKVQILNELAEENRYADHEEMLRYSGRALEISQDIGYRKGIAVAYNNIGTYYRIKGIYNESIDYYFDALEIMEGLKDEQGIARCYNLIGILYYALENYELSMEYYLRALEMNLEQQDRRWIAGNSNNLGMVYEKMGDYEKAKEYYIKSLEMNLELGDKNWIANNYGNLGSLYLLTGNPASIDYFNKRLAITEEQADTMGIAFTFLYIGDYYLQQGMNEEALLNYRQALEFARKTRALLIKAQASRKLSTTLAGLGDHRAALEYEKMNKVFEDSLNLTNNTEKITRLEIQYKHRKERRLKELSLKRSRTIQTAFSIVLFFLLIFIILLFNRQRIKARQNRLEHDKLTLENSMLQDELRYKEKMLEENINFLVEMNELLSGTLDRFNSIIESSKPENKRMIREIITTLQSGINDDLWKEFEVRFNQVNKDFYDRLNELYPDLTPNEKKLCAFLKLKMTSKEISSMTSLSIKSIETARSRLRKKLEIQDNAKNISDFLSEI